jgi:hypothetical protein
MGMCGYEGPAEPPYWFFFLTRMMGSRNSWFNNYYSNDALRASAHPISTSYRVQYATEMNILIVLFNASCSIKLQKVELLWNQLLLNHLI